MRSEWTAEHSPGHKGDSPRRKYWQLEGNLFLEFAIDERFCGVRTEEKARQAGRDPLNPPRGG